MKDFIRKSTNIFTSEFRNKLKSLVWNYTDWVSYNSYSNEGEDMILRKIFFKKKKGFYVDIGAYHPKKASNTYFFYKKGWKGINIDAMPGSMKLFNQVRKRDVNLEIPLGKEGQIVNYYEFYDKALNGFESQEIKEKHTKKQINGLVKIHQLNCKSLNSILMKYLDKDQKIDFLTIDVEGQEYNILKELEFEKFKPKWILAENWTYSIQELNNDSLDELLKGVGYQPMAKTLNTVFYKVEEGV